MSKLMHNILGHCILIYIFICFKYITVSFLTKYTNAVYAYISYKYDEP